MSKARAACQHLLTLSTKLHARGVCADRASAIDASGQDRRFTPLSLDHDHQAINITQLLSNQLVFSDRQTCSGRQADRYRQTGART